MRAVEFFTDNKNSSGKKVQIAAYEDAIAEEKAAIESLKLAGDIFDIKRELVQIEVEAEYRRRIKSVHTEVKKRLDYQVKCRIFQNL